MKFISNDSLSNPDPIRYNLVKFDGVGWEIKRLTYQGGSPEIRSVSVINKNDIWFDPWFHWDGQVYQEIPIDPIFIGEGINKMWGNEEVLFVVGENGFIANKSIGGVWSRIISGTESRVNDVFGILSKENTIMTYCPVSSFFVPGDKKILKIVDQKVDSVSWNRDIRLNSAWAPNENILYVCGEGNFVNKFGKWEDINLYPGATNSIRGNGLNDIFIVGDNGSIFHFNGVSWQILNIPNDKGYSKVAVKGNMVVICGNHLGKGLIEVGIRN